jgi:hypothetical protein
MPNYLHLEQLLDFLEVERWGYRRTFVRHNWPAPWSCADCGESVVLDELVVHHIDGDRKHNNVENLEPMHKSCHLRHHGRGKDLTAVSRARWDRPGEGKRYANTMQERGYRVSCEECNQPIVHWHMSRHMKAHHREAL